MTDKHPDILEVDPQAIAGIFYNIGVIASGISTEAIVAANKLGKLPELDYSLLTSERVTAVFAMLLMEFSKAHQLDLTDIIENLAETVCFNIPLHEAQVGPVLNRKKPKDGLQ
jgi:hypothetical protein